MHPEQARATLRDAAHIVDELLPGRRETRKKIGEPSEWKPLSFINPPDLYGQPVPPREWIVQDWLPSGTVTLAYGDGGVGKTLLAQQLMTSCATCNPWCGLAVMQCRTLALFCEDDEEELHRRQDAINIEYGIDFDSLGAMRWTSGVGQDNILIRFDQEGCPVLTPRFEELKREAIDFGARLVIIDTAADTFGGNENDRAQVRQFVGNALGRLAREIGGAVLVNAHPSKTGLAVGGSMDSGSTGWSNSARSRWALARPDPVEGIEVDASERILTRRKANYATIGDEIKLRWRRGVLVPTARPAGTMSAMTDRTLCEAVFLDLLAKCDASNMPVAFSNKAGNYAPAVFSKRPDRQGFGRREFDAAMSSLMSAGRIKLQVYGRSGDARRRIVASDPTDVANSDDWEGILDD